MYQLSQPEGRLVAKEGGGFKNQFDYKDHLGNLRLVYEGEGTPVSNVYPAPVIVQENAYYPFGLAHTGTDYQQPNLNNFQYNGIEYNPLRKSTLHFSETWTVKQGVGGV